MNRNRERGGARRRPQSKRPAPIDIWTNPRPLGELEKLHHHPEPGTLLRSLGDPPMANAVAAGHYFSAVIERAAAVAVALALSADLLVEGDATD